MRLRHVFRGAVAVIPAAALAATVLPARALAEDFAKQMDQYLADDENVEKIANAMQRYLQAKRAEQQKMAAKAEEQQLEEQFKDPVKVDIGDSPVRGPEDAPITIVEFSDFQCPFCQRGANTVDDIMKQYKGKVKHAFKNLPLAFHPQAKPAAIAALAAHRQGKFWEYHDELFANRESLGPDLYVDLAKKLKLDVDKFKKDLEDKAIEKQVDEDAALATKLGIRGTPGYFINGVQLKGAQPLPKFKMVIDRWLEKK